MMKVLKVFYALSFMLCLIQLMFWLFTPFMGIGAIYRMIIEDGLLSHQKEIDLAQRFGLSEDFFNVINRCMVFIYFISLTATVVSIFFLKLFDKRKVFIFGSCLFILALFILFILPIAFK